MTKFVSLVATGALLLGFAPVTFAQETSALTVVARESSWLKHYKGPILRASTLKAAAQNVRVQQNRTVMKKEAEKRQAYFTRNRRITRPTARSIRKESRARQAMVVSMRNVFAFVASN